MIYEFHHFLQNLLPKSFCMTLKLFDVLISYGCQKASIHLSGQNNPSSWTFLDIEYASLSLEGDDVQCLEVLVSGSPLMFKQGLSNIHENI